MTASFATRPDTTRGRLYPEEGSAHRTCFQRDRDRIIHASAFRRLKHKTQVFVEHEGDYYRTRLTHSIEVAQVARTLARSLGLNEELAEAVALAHDLGHPPFGHTGEDELKELMEPFGGFDHNAQAIKIVTKLEAHYADFDGLNLTWETLEGIAKHNGPVVGDVPFALSEFNAVYDLGVGDPRERGGTGCGDRGRYCLQQPRPGRRLRAGLFTLEDLRCLPMIGRCIAEVDARWPGLSPARREHEALRRFFGLLVEDVLATSLERIEEFAPKDVQAVRHLGVPVVRFSEGTFTELKEIRTFLYYRMYRQWGVQRMRRKAKIVVRQLFEIFNEAPGLMPDDWNSVQALQDGRVGRARIVTDYIAGMTDRFALQEHRKLTDPNVRA